MTYRSGHKEIEQLVTLGKERGYLTFEEVNDALPPDVLSTEDSRARNPLLFIGFMVQNQQRSV